MPKFPHGAVAVIFLSKRNEADPEGYAAAAAGMVKAAEGSAGDDTCFVAAQFEAQDHG
ncbi:MAG TPA: hypothetical protein VHX18_13625 [Rhizomicrobium sp.]|jgi:hypothetical protein|nr:hypothetical protein [Rhizomicrobium sp.]